MEPRLDGIEVRVVDDTASVRQAVTDILENDGAKVTAVGSAEEELERCNVNAPACW